MYRKFANKNNELKIFVLNFARKEKRFDEQVLLAVLNLYYFPIPHFQWGRKIMVRDAFFYFPTPHF